MPHVPAKAHISISARGTIQPQSGPFPFRPRVSYQLTKDDDLEPVTVQAFVATEQGKITFCGFRQRWSMASTICGDDRAVYSYYVNKMGGFEFPELATNG